MTDETKQLVRDAYNEGYEDSALNNNGDVHLILQSWADSGTARELEKTEADRFVEQMESASEIVATWPAWKRNLLNNSPSGEARKPC